MDANCWKIGTPTSQVSTTTARSQIGVANPSACGTWKAGWFHHFPKFLQGQSRFSFFLAWNQEKRGHVQSQNHLWDPWFSGSRCGLVNFGGRQNPGPTLLIYWTKKILLSRYKNYKAYTRSMKRQWQGSWFANFVSFHWLFCCVWTLCHLAAHAVATSAWSMSQPVRPHMLRFGLDHLPLWGWSLMISHTESCTHDVGISIHDMIWNNIPCSNGNQFFPRFSTPWGDGGLSGTCVSEPLVRTSTRQGESDVGFVSKMGRYGGGSWDISQSWGTVIWMNMIYWDEHGSHEIDPVTISTKEWRRDDNVGTLGSPDGNVAQNPMDRWGWRPEIWQSRGYISAWWKILQHELVQDLISPIQISKSRAFVGSICNDSPQIVHRDHQK